MKKFIPVQLTQPYEEGQERPRDLGWKDLGPLRVLGVTRDRAGNVAMEFGCSNTRVTLVASQRDGITVYRNDSELVEST